MSEGQSLPSLLFEGKGWRDQQRWANFEARCSRLPMPSLEWLLPNDYISLKQDFAINPMLTYLRANKASSCRHSSNRFLLSCACSLVKCEYLPRPSQWRKALQKPLGDLVIFSWYWRHNCSNTLNTICADPHAIPLAALLAVCIPETFSWRPQDQLPRLGCRATRSCSGFAGRNRLSGFNRDKRPPELCTAREPLIRTCVSISVDCMPLGPKRPPI